MLANEPRAAQPAFLFENATASATMRPARRRLALLLGALLAALPAAGQAPETPETPAELPEGTGTPATGWVRDEVGLLYDHQKAELDRRLADHEAATTNQVVVEIVHSTGGRPIDDFAIDEATRLAIGQKGKDNGVLLVVAYDDRAARIEVGYGLEDRLTDALAGRILREEVVPRFREGDYPAGLAAGVDAILGALEGSYRGSFLDRAPVVSTGLEWIRERIDRLPPLSVGDQVFFGIFLFVFGPLVSLLAFAWLTWKKLGAWIGLGLFAAVGGTLVWHYPWMLGALVVLVGGGILLWILNWLQKKYPDLFPATRGGGSSGGRGGGSSSSSYSSSSSSSRSFSGGGGSFGGGGASARW